MEVEKETAIWFAMRATYRRETDAMRLLAKENLGCFVKSMVAYLQYITDTRSGKKIIIPDNEMQRFIAVAGTYNDHLLYFQPDELNLSKGTKVRITGGDFEGQEGVFLKVKGARDRRVVIAIQGVIAVAMATIHPDLIEVIK